MTDPFATAAIRQRVLAAWAASPVRFREDANAEEDLALGGYRDRLVVELAQNAADAAARAGVAGQVSFTLRSQDAEGPVLVVANTGAPLTADGVQSLSTLRASAKRDDEGSATQVGRFGVGFAAVLAVCDEPVVLSREGGVRFSRDDTAALVSSAGEAAPGLADELRRRARHVPVLRLPFEAEGGAPQGFDTAVVLALRDEAAADVVREQLAAMDDALLLALPALESVSVDVEGDVRVVSGAAQRWRVHRRAGEWTDDERARLLADRPTEERRQRGWQVLWAVPRSAGVEVPRVVHAPTPTDEPSSFPALLLASLPLDPTRRHVAAGPLADRVIAECAGGYAGLLHELAADGVDVLPLVPVGLPAGAVDGALREQVLELLPGVALLPAVEDGHLVRPRDAVVLDVDLDDGAAAVLAPRVAGLVAASRRSRPALRALGVTTLPLADVVDALAGEVSPASAYALYDGLASLADDANAREAMGALPVPLADGRAVRGARGLLLPEGRAVPAESLKSLAPYGLRVVHPDAAHRLLGRLGAVPSTPVAVLADPAVRVAVEESPDGDDVVAVVGAVLALVRGAVESGEPVHLPWLRDLALPDDEGELAPAGALALPGSVAERLLDPDEIGVVDASLADVWPAEVLRACGVLDSLAVVQASDVDLHDLPDEVAELDGAAEWADEVASSGGVVGELLAVRDLDVVRTGAWPEALRHLACEPTLRRALLATARVSGPVGVRTVPGLTSWWLGRELRLGGTAAPGSDTLDGLLDEAPGWVAELDPEVRAALGVVDLSADRGGDRTPPGPVLSPDAVQRIVDALADRDREPGAVACLRAWRRLAQIETTDVAVSQQVRVLDGDSSRLVGHDDAVVADDPRWLQRDDLGGLVVAPAGRAHALADLLDVDLAGERAAGHVTSHGTRTPVPDAVRVVLPTAPAWFVEHDDLRVDAQPVAWWVDGDGTPHAATADGLARALAWAAGEWQARHLAAHVLAEAGDAVRLAVEDACG